MTNKANTAEDMARTARITKQFQDGICFVIMSFSGNPILESYFEEAIKPVVEEFKLECVRVDQEEFTGKITDQIKQNSVIIIIDLTEDRPNCYFEAGYAVARSKSIIFQRLDAPKYEPVFHFDVKDYPHILYGTIADLRKKLKGRLKALLNKP